MAPKSRNYGTVGHSQQSQDRTAATPHAEDTTLLGKRAGHAISQKLRDHMSADITKSWGDIALLGCYIITGLLDSSSASIWGSFVSMQTGNTVYLGLGVINPTKSDRWIRSAISISGFCLGSAFFSFYHRRLSPRKRWVLVTSYLIQTTLTIAAALMVTFGFSTGSDDRFPIALISFQAAGQAVTSRVLQYAGLTSVVLTSNYCDLFSDPRLFAGFRDNRHNTERNRNLAAPILLLSGALLGGVWANSSTGLAGALWTAVILKTVVTLAWFFWAAQPSESSRLE